jgi:UDP-N-acetylmuramate dehydrogenase
VSKPDWARAQATSLEALLPGAVFRDVPLDRISRWKIGGPADIIVRPRSIEDLSRLRRFLHDRDLPHLVIGGTSNLLFADAGLRVICVQIGSAMAAARVEGTAITGDAGVWVPGLARLAMQHGLEGLAHTCGIPGTLGGLVCMNGGSQRHGIHDTVDTVTSVARDGSIIVRRRAECGFAYRRSVYQTNDEIIARARLVLRPAADKAALRREMLGILRSRRRRFPNKTPNCGSVFVSDPAMYDEHGPPGAIIENMGFKGRRIGDAQVSAQHANFIVNLGRASAEDTLDLITEIRDAVHDRTGYLMEVEARFVAPDGKISNAHR